MKPAVAVATVMLGRSILAGFGRHTRAGFQPVTEAQRAQVLAAVQELRQAFNRGHCVNVLAREELRSGWTQSCDRIRETWGDWQSFAVSRTYRAGSTVILVEAEAAFAKGNCTVQASWDLVTGSPHMMAFFLRSKDGDEDFPPLPPRFMDPPPAPDKAWPSNA